MKKAVSLLLIVCLAITLLAGCSGNASQPSSEPPAAQETAAPQTDASQGESEPAAKKTMVIGDTTFNSENWEETVDPHRTYNGWACIRYGIGETLVHYTDSMELEPWLAKSWENDGNLTWTITLQDNVTFSSGREMDAEAVKQCFEHLLENHDRAPGDTKIADMQADGQVLTITTSEPNPALMNYLGDPYGCIIDVDASDFDVGIVAGTGPYVVTDMVTDDHLTLTKNENYWNGTPKIDELIIRTLSNGDTLSAALQAGDIDAAYGMAYEAYPNFENGNYQFSSIQTSRAFFASMNMTSPIIQDAAVRKAIAMGIDKQGFVSALLDGHGVPGNGAFPDGFATFGGENVTTESYDPEDAKAVLEAAGWLDSDGDGIREKDGVKASTTFLYSAGDDVRQTIAMAVSNQILENLGIEMIVEGVSWDELPARMYSEPLVLAWGSSNPKTSYMLYHSSNAGKDDWYNPENFSNKTVDGYLDAALSARSLEEAIPFWQKAQWDGETGTSMRGECSYIFVLNKTHVYWAREGLDTGVQKIHAHGDAWPLVQNIAEWTWTK